MSATAVHRADSQRSLEVVIIGAGFGGIAAAIELRRHGIAAITILEKAPDLGGTWFYNSYPGAACDVASHLYSFSYAQRRDWERLCPTQQDIHSYMHDVAREHHIDELIRTGTTVSACTWDAARCRWSIETESGSSYEADAVILATGQLHQPHRPQLKGAETFAGNSFHSSEWDHDYSFAGKRVAVVGTGASAVQFIPEIAPEVEQLTVFQRTGNWFMPRRNRRYPALVRALIEGIPGLQQLRRAFWFQYGESHTVAIRHPRGFGRVLGARSARFMRGQLRDPALRARVWPDYTFGCKRVLFSSYFLPALERANVELVTEPITELTAEGLRSADGRLHEVDCLIWATGFKTNDFMFPMEISGIDGLSLHEYWSAGAHAHLGVSVPGFPNMFLLYGPNTNTSGGSILVYLEAQSAYLRQALEQLLARGAGAIEVRPEVEAASDRALQARFAGTAWTQCDSWYRNDRGRIVANWPGYMREYLQRTAQLEVDEFELLPVPERAAVTGA